MHATSLPQSDSVIGISTAPTGWPASCAGPPAPIGGRARPARPRVWSEHPLGRTHCCLSQSACDTPRAPFSPFPSSSSDYRRKQEPTSPQPPTKTCRTGAYGAALVLSPPPPLTPPSEGKAAKKLSKRLCLAVNAVEACWDPLSSDKFILVCSDPSSK